ncbi:MAG: YggS family pyridoxal phosphate-dependent enzyme [Bacteroidota bacterium]|nr:YggS family pyridoxal phosphate-dependent enzyme [Bacteroidota bacterium]
MCIADNIKQLKNKIPNTVTVVAVSKTKSVEDILQAYATGHYNFGENKVQELVAKSEELPKDIKWHMIGHLQTNKVKYIAPFVSLIHGVDSLKLLKEINKRAAQNKRIIDCLLQVHIAEESTKFGFDVNGIAQVLKDIGQFKNINIKGLMGIATHTTDTAQINKEFALIDTLYNKIKSIKINTLSIGMSADYKLAINNGSTMVRIGSAIFSAR